MPKQSRKRIKSHAPNWFQDVKIVESSPGLVASTWVRIQSSASSQNLNGLPQGQDLTSESHPIRAIRAINLFLDLVQTSVKPLRFAKGCGRQQFLIHFGNTT